MEEQRCGSCGELKSVEEFSFRNRITRKRHTTCRACQKTFKQNFYQRNRQAYLDRSAKQKIEAIARNRKLLSEYLRVHPCVDCGESDVAVLEFDHLKDKERSIGQLVLDGVSWQKILAEIAKCEVRCVNCHRKKTAERFNWYKFLGL